MHSAWFGGRARRLRRVCALDSSASQHGPDVAVAAPVTDLLILLLTAALYGAGAVFVRLCDRV
jgi:hypothetical protein